jgi:hypothetical protein
MLGNIQGIEKFQEIEAKQKKKAKAIKEFIEQRKEYLSELRDYYRFHAFSVDTGDFPIELDYTIGRYFRCADSDGKVYVDRAVPEEVPSEDVIDFVDGLFKEEPLKDLLDILEIKNWSDLSYLVTLEEGKKDSTKPPRNLREFLRECLEWAVLLGYARKNTKVILLRDGLLRNKIFKREVRDPNSAYYRLQSKVTEICQKNENLIVGVAKSSSLLRHLDIYLQDTSVYKSGKPFVLRIENDHELMTLSYTYDLYREGEVVFGKNLHLARFKENIRADIFTLEIPEFAETNWDGVPEGRRRQYKDKSYEYVVSLIAGLPKRTLPDRFNGAPEPLARAHEHARTKKVTAKGIEIKIKKEIKSKED